MHGTARILTAALLALATLVVGAPGAQAAIGTDGDDHLQGTWRAERMHGLAGHDYIDGRGGNDVIFGGSEQDEILGGPGQDTIRGGSDNDLIRVKDGEADVVDCGDGDFDQVIADAAIDTVRSNCEWGAPGGIGQLKVISMGDSIAAGEGINYGFNWNFPKLSWDKPTDPSPTWDGTYQVCHQASKAYGNQVANRMNARFYKTACTGATYAEGITGPMQFGTVTVPSQLSQLTDLKIKPDVVLISIGANDVKFSTILRNCITSNLFFPSDPECTATKPGQTIQTNFWNQIDTVATNWNTLATTIQDMYGGPGKPIIVFTTYYDPLVAGTGSNKCTDNLLAQKQNAYLGSLLGELTTRLKTAVGGREGVIVSDNSQIMVGHTWCTEDPLSYGPGTIAASGDFSNAAPVHPTPEGHAEIASLAYLALVARLTS